jgi:hypothetical protein
VLSDPVGWAKGWGALAADVAADPVMRNRVMFDLMNEPDGRGIGWTTVSVEVFFPFSFWVIFQFLLLSFDIDPLV